MQEAWSRWVLFRSFALLVGSLLLVDVVEARSRSRREQAEERARPDDADPQPHPTPTVG